VLGVESVRLNSELEGLALGGKLRVGLLDWDLHPGILVKGRLVIMKWLEYISVAEAVVIRLGGLILIAIFIGKAILHEFAR
jgi:hypothetical protein